ncbi:MAG TPA: fluoride efflux transporter CrcB [Burkholderiales bacterium]|nr:fluoride efflux transporter CrcB [Burkholderiales bacterium]
MKLVLLVAAGGAAGAVARYKLAGLVTRHAVAAAFPYGTFAVNVLGCLLAGLLIGVAGHYSIFTAQARVLVFTGFLGGFTTFSAFGIETVALLERGQYLMASSYVVLSVLCGLAVLWAGMKLGGLGGG